jgi:8-oxo-dGTP pyrophosphatase MutT (NUDIX family)
MGPMATVPNAGLPAAFRKKTPNGNARMGAGVMFTKDGKALFLRRKGADHAGEWAFPGGHVEEDEEPADAARREAMEEVGQLRGWALAPLHRETRGDIDFTTFGQPVAEEFAPILNDEHDDFRWATLDKPPLPLHPGVAALLEKFFAEEAQEADHAGSSAAEELRRKFAAKVPGANDSAIRFALDSVRSFDSDGRMRVAIANISKATVNPYRGEEIPGWEEIGLEKDKIYQMFRPPDELQKAAATFNGVQLLKKHLPVDSNDHQMWDIVGCTGTDAKFDGTYLTNSLSVWTKEGIDFIETGDQRELSCGYHYVPLMTSGNFGGKHYDGIMTEIEGNHVALVEEGRAGHDVVVGDSALDRREDMKPTRLEYVLLTRCARAINPLLAKDAKVEYGPIFKGLTTKNFKERKPHIINGLQVAVKGRTIAKDASLEHVANFLNTFEHTPPAEKSWWKSADESVSGPQHRAMEAAAHGQSNLGIPAKVGKEFEHADKGKKFGDMIRDWASARDWSEPMGDADFENLEKMHGDCMMDEMPGEAALDAEGEEVNIEVEEGEDGRRGRAKDRRGAKDKRRAKDKDIEQEEAEDKDDVEQEEAEDRHDADDEVEQEEGEDARHADDRHADDRRGAKDRKRAKDRKGAMDQRPITQDALNKAIVAATTIERKRAADAVEARAFVRPFVGEVPLALDSAEAILRSAAKAMQIEDAATVHASALKPLIKLSGQKKIASDSRVRFEDLATDEADEDSGSFDKMFPNAARIGFVG